MLQNCHLSVEFCDEIIQTVSDTETIHENFKLWITSEINKNFPMSLLQMLIKYTNEPLQVRPMVNAVNTLASYW